MNFVFISPNFPVVFSHFVKSLKEQGFNVLGIGDAPYSSLNEELKTNLTEYCQVIDMNNIQWMIDTINYLKSKYGEIDYLESNNEYWLFNDSILREKCNIKNGLRPHEMDLIKYKSKMKQGFQKAGVNVARYILANDINECRKFAKKVGYPLFAKPDNGVGAASTYKINNDDELNSFFINKTSEQYILEEYLDGYIITFDGICDDNSNVVVSFNEIFPTPIARVVRQNLDMFYYAKSDFDEKFKTIGENVIKAFNVKSRCFHIEFFVLNSDKNGLGKKGDLIGLEVNMRSPGGNTPDLLTLTINDSYYDIYAKTLAKVINSHDFSNHLLSVSVNKKHEYQYKNSHAEIIEKYSKNIKNHDFYSKEIRDALGDEYYFAVFKTEQELLDFKNFVLEKLN